MLRFIGRGGVRTRMCCVELCKYFDWQMTFKAICIGSGVKSRINNVKPIVMAAFSCCRVHITSIFLTIAQVFWAKRVASYLCKK